MSTAGRDDELSINAGFFGEFTVAPDCLTSDLAMACGQVLESGEEAMSLRLLITRRLGRQLVEGDRVRIGAFELTVRHTDDHGDIDQVGLKCPRLLP